MQFSLYYIEQKDEELPKQKKEMDIEDEEKKTIFRVKEVFSMCQNVLWANALENIKLYTLIVRLLAI